MRALEFSLFLHHPPEYDASESIKRHRADVKRLCGNKQKIECLRQPEGDGSGVPLNSDCDCPKERPSGRACVYECAIVEGSETGRVLRIIINFVVPEDDERSHGDLCPDFISDGILNEGLTPNGDYIGNLRIIGMNDQCASPSEWDVQITEE
jgi:hypothetical protein